MTRARFPQLLIHPGLDGAPTLLGDFVTELPEWLDPVVYGFGHTAIPPLDLPESWLPPERKYFLLAESASGPRILHHAAKRPPGLLGVVLVATFLHDPLPAPFGHLRGLVRGPLTPRPSRRAIRHWMTGEDAPDSLVHRLHEAIHRVPKRTLAGRIRQVLGADARAAAEQVEVPVLHLSAGQDKLLGRRGRQQLERSGMDLESVVLDGPHLLLQTRPVQTAEIVCRFLHRVLADQPMPTPPTMVAPTGEYRRIRSALHNYTVHCLGPFSSFSLWDPLVKLRSGKAVGEKVVLPLVGPEADHAVHGEPLDTALAHFRTGLPEALAKEGVPNGVLPEATMHMERELLGWAMRIDAIDGRGQAHRTLIPPTAVEPIDED